MSELKHTPGPWQWIAEDESLLGLWGPEYGGVDHVLSVSICDACAARNAPCLSPNEADSALIAASPDLLAACEWAVAMNEKQLKTLRAILGAEYEWPAVHRQMMDAILAAVAKAKGVTPCEQSSTAPSPTT